MSSISIKDADSELSAEAFGDEAHVAVRTAVGQVGLVILTPQDAREMAEWLSDFAEAHGAPVTLPWTLNELRDVVHNIATSKGWHDKPACRVKGTDHPEDLDNPEEVDFDVVARMIALIHSEASEALEELREDRPGRRRMQLYIDAEGKPQGVATEFVDVIIRCLDTAGALGLNMDAALKAKLEYNRSRPARHGGKNI